jgi:hypothetical protein
MLIVPEEANCSLHFSDSWRRATESGSDVAEIDLRALTAATKFAVS